MSVQAAGQIQFVSVISSNVESIGFDPDPDVTGQELGAGTLGTLYVWFHVKRHGQIVGKRLYEYYDVPATLHQSFLGAASKGTFHWDNVRGRFNFKEL